MQNKIDLIRNKLFSFRDIEYKEFNKKLVPGIDENFMIGIRIPVLRKFAKEFFKLERMQAIEFMKILPHEYFEENNLHAFFIENIKNFDEAILETERFLPYIDNWETCDLFSPPLFKKFPEQVYNKILVWIKSEHTYTVRYAIGLLLQNYLDDNFKTEMLELVSNVKSEEYYVNMMIAWYFSIALVKQYNDAIPYIQNKTLNVFTHNKAIQKAIESRQISIEKKAYLKTLKVKT